jgi:NitT/TauT family transport system substrate-binding protein
MRTLFTRFSPIITLLLLLILASCGSQSPTTGSGQLIVRLGYFPNLTHAVALVGVERGTFQQALGSNVKLETKTFNAGPALIEALFAGDIDIGYVGPNPAINGYVQSHGGALRIIAGASSGGVLFVVSPVSRFDEQTWTRSFASPLSLRLS